VILFFKSIFKRIINLVDKIIIGYISLMILFFKSIFKRIVNSVGKIKIGLFIQILALMVACYSLYRTSKSNEKSSKQYAESIIKDSIQHFESVTLLKKYNAYADSMLVQLKQQSKNTNLQSKTADLQYKSQLTLSAPKVLVEFVVHDTLNTSAIVEGEKYIIPEVRLIYSSFGGRTAKNFRVKPRIYSPETDLLNSFDDVKMSDFYSGTNNFTLVHPLISDRDKNKFYLIYEASWTDELNNNKTERQLYFYKFYREKNNRYSVFSAEDESVRLKIAVTKPRKTFEASIKGIYVRKYYNMDY